MHRSTLWAAVAAVATACGALVASPPPAAAFSLLGCRFDADRPVVGYTVADLGDLTAAVAAATRAWNRSPGVPGRFVRSPAPAPSDRVGASTPRLQIGRVDSVIDAWGWIGDPTSRPPRCLGGAIDPFPDNRTSIYLNAVALAGLEFDQQVLVVQHELGHALGLGHPRGGCRTRPAVMIQGAAKWRCGWRGSAPWPDDRAGVRRIYGATDRG